MRPIIEYIDYRECIRDYYEERKARKGFSWASFAESAGLSSPVFLQYVCEGKKNLGERTAPQVADAMGLAGFESTFFCKLVALDNAKSEDDKKGILEDIAELARIHKVKLVTAEEYQFFKSWKNSLIRELAPAMDGASPKELSKATRYRIKTGEVREILDFLQEAGYLTQDEQGHYRPLAPHERPHPQHENRPEGRSPRPAGPNGGTCRRHPEKRPRPRPQHYRSDTRYHPRGLR